MGTRKLGPLVHSKSPEIEYKSLRPKCRKNLGSGSLSVGCAGGKGNEAGSGERGAGSSTLKLSLALNYAATIGQPLGSGVSRLARPVPSREPALTESPTTPYHAPRAAGSDAGKTGSGIG